MKASGMIHKLASIFTLFAPNASSFCKQAGARSTALILFAVAVNLLTSGCQPRGDYAYISSSNLSKISREPLIRVRIIPNASQVRLEGPSRLSIGPHNPSAPLTDQWTFATPVTISRSPDAFVVQPVQGKAMTWRAPTLSVQPPANALLRVQGVDYHGKVVLHAGVPSTSSFDVINHLPLEDYLSGVLQKELFPTWSPVTFRAQAIAARSYAIVQGAANQKRHFDVEATTASQAYSGAQAHSRARKAVRDTRGVVLSYRGQVLPAYYSSCCGGLGQDATVAFPYGENIPPLRGHNQDGWCAISPNFRWGPVTRSRDQLAQQLVAWGREKRNPLAKLNGIAGIAVTARNPAGRPARFAITDLSGQVFEVAPESFRFASNFAAAGAPELPKTAVVKSSDLSIHVQGDRVVFAGRGYGHGVGMCQWGAEGMARSGHHPNAILSFYYPGAGIGRAY